MKRNRPATEAVAQLDRAPIERALESAHVAESEKVFYDLVEMPNPSRSYFVRHRDRLHSLKAIVTCALREHSPTTLARDFHAVDAAARLRLLGFDVVHEEIER